MDAQPTGPDPWPPIFELVQERRFDEAREALDQFQGLELSENDAGIRLGLELACALAEGQEEEVEAGIDQILTDTRSSPATLNALGTTLSDVEQLDAAERVLTVLVDRDPDSAIAGFNLGLVYRRQGRAADALDIFRETLDKERQRDQVDLDLRLNIATCQEALGHWDTASALYRELIVDHPDVVDLWRDLAFCEEARGRPAEAAEALERYIQANPDDAGSWVSLGNFHDDAQNLPAAEIAWRKAMELEPGSENAVFNWAISASRRNDRDRLERCVEHLDDHFPGGAYTAAVRAFLHEVEGEIWLGWEEIRQSIDRCGDDEQLARFLTMRAIGFARRHELEDGLTDLVAELHRRDLFDDDILRELAELGGELSPTARNFTVLIDALPNAAWLDPEALDPLGEPMYRFIRSLHVIAPDSRTARDLAIEFEERGGAADVRVDEIEDLGEVGEAYVGVWSRASTLHYYPREQAE